MRALLVVDLQHDFLPGGALAVPEGDRVIPVANRLLREFPLVVATQDWHPADHLSFASQHPGHRVFDEIALDGLPQILWPDHCVQGTWGAEFSQQLAIAPDTQVVRKGIDRAIDSYSAFFDNSHRRATGLAELLHRYQVQDVYVLGLALDYCVRFTTCDGMKLGFRMRVIEDGCRAVNREPGDADRALEAIRVAGAGVLHSTELCHPG